MDFNKLKEGLKLLERAIIKFNDAGFSVRSLLDYKHNIQWHLKERSKNEK